MRNFKKIYEKCPICNSSIEAITNEDEYVIDWYCSKCGISWKLEDLEYEPIQESLGKWI